MSNEVDCANKAELVTCDIKDVPTMREIDPRTIVPLDIVMIPPLGAPRNVIPRLEGLLAVRTPKPLPVLTQPSKGDHPQEPILLLPMSNPRHFSQIGRLQSDCQYNA
jgi:hypothetical protein